MNILPRVMRSIVGQMSMAGAAVLCLSALTRSDGAIARLGIAAPGIGVLLACIGIVMFHAARIRAQARALAPQVDDQGIHPIAADGIPQEARPLIEALNRRIGKIADIGDRQRFFLSAAAHEMRTPLTIVRTRLELLDDTPLKGELIADMRRLSRLVNDLLTLMSIRGRERVLSPVDLANCCHRVIDQLDSVAAARAVRVKLVGGNDSMRVLGDAGLLEVGITNLVQNAIAHSPLGGTVSIALDRPARLSVIDQGAGIPPAQAEALFDPFVRLSNDPGGYGLGLTIVRSIADVHGASARASNTADGGAMFVLELQPA